MVTTLKTEILEPMIIPIMTGQRITSAVIGLDEHGNRTARIEFEDGTWLEFQADGQCANMSFTYTTLR